MSLIKYVVAFGKIYFIPRDESIPLLPEMSLLFLKDGGQGAIFPWRAACIDLEMDACGSSINDAAKNLKKSLLMYIEMQKEAANGSIMEAAKIINKAAFSKSKQKQEYFNLYRQAKENYIMQTNEEKISVVVKEKERRQKKLKIEKEAAISAFNKVNDEVWEGIMASFTNKKITSTPAVSQNWVLLYTPSNSSRIPAQMLKNKNWEYLIRGPSGLLLSNPYNG